MIIVNKRADDENQLLIQRKSLRYLKIISFNDFIGFEETFIYTNSRL